VVRTLPLAVAAAAAAAAAAAPDVGGAPAGAPAAAAGAAADGDGVGPDTSLFVVQLSRLHSRLRTRLTTLRAATCLSASATAGGGAAPADGGGGGGGAAGAAGPAAAPVDDASDVSPADAAVLRAALAGVRGELATYAVANGTLFAALAARSPGVTEAYELDLRRHDGCVADAAAAVAEGSAAAFLAVHTLDTVVTAHLDKVIVHLLPLYGRLFDEEELHALAMHPLWGGGAAEM